VPGTADSTSHEEVETYYDDGTVVDEARLSIGGGRDEKHQC
jgi:hypothetical protein